MVDLDSDPTKLIEIVESAKQSADHARAWQTFTSPTTSPKTSLIIPAMFMDVFPVLDDINIMRLESPRSRSSPRSIFNALIIVG